MYFSRFVLLLLLNLKTLNCYTTTCEPVISIDPPPIVEIPGFGKFRGSATVSLRKERPIFQFLGIPFAVPPMGPLRFKAPVPLKELNPEYVYSAKNFKLKCPQLVNEEDFAYLQKNYDAAEDCLYLNVFTVTNSGENHKTLLPVLVYIHGGGYYQGSASDQCPNYLLDNDMVLVTLQYRLGPLGFLNLETEDVSGNMGLLDTLEALEWVNRNIKYFGGDNQRITVSGQSSGGNSVSLLLVSPLVRADLFQQVIVQSGNFLADWAVDRDSKQHALEWAHYVNCTQTDMTELVDCLRNISSFQIISTHLKYMEDRVISTKNMLREIGINHAVVQKSGIKKFLTEDPVEAIKNGQFLKVPILTGVTKDEGSWPIELWIQYILEPATKRLHLTKQNESVYLKNEFFYDFLKFNGITENIQEFELLKELYLPDYVCENFNDTIPGLVDLGGALEVKTSILKLARIMRPHVPTYLYSFNFKGARTKLGYGKPLEHIYFDGVAHSDELLYLFPDSRYRSLNPQEREVIESMVDLWFSFVNNGGKFISTSNLTNWPPMNTTIGSYLQIDKKLEIKQNFLKEYKHHVNMNCKMESSSTELVAKVWLPFTLLIFIFAL